MGAVSPNMMVCFEPIVSFEPLPLQITLLKREAIPEGDSTGVFQVWRTVEGERCRRCSPGLCTLNRIPGLEAYATCTFMVAGHVSARLAATLTRGV